MFFLALLGTQCAKLDVPFSLTLWTQTPAFRIGVIGHDAKKAQPPCDIDPDRRPSPSPPGDGLLV